ncbi:choice-of-anchor A family protein [Agromyces sp. Marseille-Q5079]|uniref:choice-of-anchor A family protein n=1 Tax=Agromyces sp. Marseille-Q5079 TaxID=3439059 RepID=UPI003D9CA9EB
MITQTRNASRRARVAKRIAGTTMALAGVALVIGSIPSAFAVEVDGNTPLDPCLGDRCPTEWQVPNNLGVIGFDDGVNVFVGGDFSAEPSAAETEGNLVVLGDASFDRGGGSYVVGVAGVGSRVPPPSGSTMLTVGGDLTISDSTTLIVGGDTGFPDFTPIVGNVEYGGTLTGTPSVVGGATVEQGDGASAFTDRLANVTALSQCFAALPDTGTVTTAGGLTTFTGDGVSDPQVFTVEGTLGPDQVAVTGADVQDGATVIINVTGEAASVSINSWFIDGSNTFDPEITQQIVTNFPDATSVEVTGGAQLPGSILVGNPASTTTLSIAGTNGRIEVAGDLVHRSPVGGQTGVEMHAYPFSGEVDCVTPPTTTTSAPPTTTTAPPTTTTAPPTTTIPTTTPATPTVTPTATSTAAPAELAESGSPAGAMMAVGAVLIGAGAVTVLTGRRRRA